MPINRAKISFVVVHFLAKVVRVLLCFLAER